VLGQRIRELRSKKGFSQESFADHCGMHRTWKLAWASPIQHFGLNVPPLQLQKDRWTSTIPGPHALFAPRRPRMIFPNSSRAGFDIVN
jgi:hypothetical protein